MLNTSERELIEKNILQYCLNGLNDFTEVQNSGITKESFHNKTSRQIYLSIESFIKQNRRVPETCELYTYMVSSGKNSIGDLAREIVELTSYSFQLSTIEKLIDDNIENDVKSLIAQRENLPGLDYATYLNENISNIILQHTSKIKNDKSTAKELKKIIKQIESGKSFDEYIKTGITAIDKHVMGIPKRHITVIGARPGQGKTTFGLQLIRNFINQGLKVGLFSLEMDLKDLLIKEISAQTNINSIDIENNNLSSRQYDLIGRVESKIKAENLIVSDKAYQTPQQIKATINSWKIKYAVDVIVIDYLHLIKTNYKKERYDLEIGQLSNDLRIFAKETGTPIIILSQLNRQAESRSYSKPIVADLRESGSIEQDAKLILLLYYPDKYSINIRDEGFKRFSDFDVNNYRDSDGKGIPNNYYFEVLIGKARSGRTGTVRLKYMPEYNRFESIKKISEYQVNEEPEENGVLEFPI